MALPTPLNLNISTFNSYTWPEKFSELQTCKIFSSQTWELSWQILKCFGPATSLPLQHLNLLALAT